jgi:hypothetical protein
MATDTSPISSKKILLPFAGSNLPVLLLAAQVNDPFSCPNSSDSVKVADTVFDNEFDRVVILCLNAFTPKWSTKRAGFSSAPTYLEITYYQK